MVVMIYFATQFKKIIDSDLEDISLKQKRIAYNASVRTDADIFSDFISS